MCVRKAKNAAPDVLIFGQIQIGLSLTERKWSVQLMMGPASLFAPTVDLQDVLRGYPPRNTDAPGHFFDPPRTSLPTKKVECPW